VKVVIPISVGELLDKITILEIKSLLCYSEYVERELEELNKIKNTITSYTEEYMNQLREVNQKLWKIEDRLRVLEKEQRFDNEFIELARSVYKTNDKRAEIKRKINEETKSIYKEVKIYS
jgi:predicted  nucleic acid-binding Zn-ribbon protein